MSTKKKPHVGYLDEKTLNTIRGKALVGAATPDEILSVFAHLDELESRLETAESDDVFGTEGWRHFFGLPE